MSKFEPKVVTLDQPTLSDLKKINVRDLVFAHKILVIRGAKPIGPCDFVGLAAQWAGGIGQLLRWQFGYRMELNIDPKKNNYLFSSERVPLHWDGAFHREPAILVFQCIESDGRGGRTVFSDTTEVLKRLPLRTKEALASSKLLLKTEKRAHYGGEVTVEPLSKHPVTGAEVLRYAEPVETQLNPVEVRLAGACRTDTYDQIKHLCYHEDLLYCHEWQPGDILLSDNHALLHGREQYPVAQKRRIQRVQIL